MPLRLRQGLGLPNPYRDLRRIQDEMNRFQRSAGWRPGIHMVTGLSEFPAINIWEGEHDIMVMAEIPGIDADALEIMVDDGVLTLKGAVAADAEARDGAYHRRERHYGNFSRTVRLPFDVDADKVQADYVHGILRVYLPRPEDRKPRRIKISQG